MANKENNKTETPSGLKYTVNKPGEGEKLGAGKSAKVHYTGTLTDGSVFDSSITRGVPFEFTVGVGQVIKGWDEAIADMKKGEKRTLEIPPDLAYGNHGHRLSGQTLIFEVELL
jgi:peptidylprolyl isomerase